MANRFALQLEECGTSAGKIDLDASVWIDGKLLDQPFYINLPDLIHSIHVPGEYDIFVCGCGSAGCAGAATVLVSHEGEQIGWRWRLPVLDSGQDSDPNAPVTTIPVEFVFERRQVIEAMASFVAAARKLMGARPDRYDWPVAGLFAKDLIALDPSKPYYARRLVSPR